MSANEHDDDQPDSEDVIETARELINRAMRIAQDCLDQRNAFRTENERALEYAVNFLTSFVSQHFPPNPDWRPLPDLLGVLTQIDNATTITRGLRAERDEAVGLLNANEDITKATAIENEQLHARTAQLEAALREARRCVDGHWPAVLERIDAALKDAPQ